MASLVFSSRTFLHQFHRNWSVLFHCTSMEHPLLSSTVHPVQPFTKQLVWSPFYVGPCTSMPEAPCTGHLVRLFFKNDRQTWFVGNYVENIITIEYCNLENRLSVYIYSWSGSLVDHHWTNSHVLWFNYNDFFEYNDFFKRKISFFIWVENTPFVINIEYLWSWKFRSGFRLLSYEIV